MHYISDNLEAFIGLCALIAAVIGILTKKPSLPIVGLLILLCAVPSGLFLKKAIEDDTGTSYKQETAVVLEDENTKDEKVAEEENGTINVGIGSVKQGQLREDDTVYWTDPVLENLIREKIGKLSGDVYVEDLDKITAIDILGDRLVFINNEEWEEGVGFRAVNSLTGKLDGYYTFYDSEGSYYEVEELGEITDISSLIYFRKLYSLFIIANKITDISVIDSMRSLDYVNVWGNQISDLSPLDRFDLDNRERNNEQNVMIGDILE